ncbi:MAG: hypothetical protein LBE34_06720 [Flavobacteriaceae bacterium]|jgi:hypothetical protein|nr:hypothetical protein [Flavobacteriaceae bacterium]
MAFQYFNTNIGYQGQDLHILRNNVRFPLHHFFKDDVALQYEYIYRLTGKETLKNYEKIRIIELAVNGKKEVYIEAEKYVSNNSEPKIHNFFITVIVTKPNDSSFKAQQVVILIHLHDELQKVWTSPEVLTLREGMAAKFGVLAIFSDGCYADVSYYPQEVKLVNTSDFIELSGEKNQRLTLKRTASTYPPKEENVVEITLPNYFKNNNADNRFIVKGFVDIQNGGNLKLHRGDDNGIDDRINVLFLSDGFNDNGVASFHRLVDQFVTRTLQNQLYSPWNILDNKLNIWSYFTKDKNNVALLESEHVIVKSGSSPIVADLNYVINVTDAIIGNLIEEGTYTMAIYANSLRMVYAGEFIDFLELRSPPLIQSSFPALNADNIVNVHLNDNNTLKLSELCGMVGLPTIEDENTNVDIRAKMLYWRTLKLVDNIIYKDDFSSNFPPPVINENTRFLTTYVFKIWKKLVNRIFLEKADTSYGITFLKMNRSERKSFLLGQELGISGQKFPPTFDLLPNLTQFGKYISNIKGNTSNTENFGKIYYHANGVPNTEIGNKEFQSGIVRQFDHIVILSRINSNDYKGGNIGVPLTDIGMVHKSILSLETNSISLIKCSTINATTNKPKTYISNEVEVNDSSAVLHNLILHELSHNYLKDEYALRVKNLSNENIDLQKKVSDYFKTSNIQTHIDLLNASGNISGEKIKWRFPIVNQIGIGIEKLQDLRNNNYSLRVRVNTGRNKKFENNDKILLRQRFLFDTNQKYVICTIVRVEEVEGDKQIISIISSETLVINQYDAFQFVIIKPYWINNNEYREVLSQSIREGISEKKKVLLSKDNIGKRDVKQLPNVEFQTYINQLGVADKSRIVGLYAGASGGAYDYNEGVYHPTGFCIMRSTKPATDPTTDRDTPNSFCPVCSYILTDYINPLLHPDMDRKYGFSVR